MSKSTYLLWGWNAGWWFVFPVTQGVDSTACGIIMMDINTGSCALFMTCVDEQEEHIIRKEKQRPHLSASSS
jgi:hypothetical protein